MQPRAGAPAVHPQPLPRGGGTLSGAGQSRAGVEALRPERAGSAHAQKPRCRFRGCRKARGQRRLRPRASASLPGRDPGLPGCPRPRAGSAPGAKRRRPLGPGQPSGRARTPFLSADECLRPASPPFSRKSNSGNVVPYLPAQLPPLTFCTLEVGAPVIMQTSGAVLRRYPEPFLFILKAALPHLHNNGLSRITQQSEAKLIFFSSASP